MANVALIETKPSRNNYRSLFNEAFEFEQFSLCSDPGITKVLKKDVDIEINIDDYDWIILVGADAFKYFTKNTAITSYTGRIVDDKFLPVINPAMIKFKPEAKKPWIESRDNIIKYITGELQPINFDSGKFIGISDPEEAKSYILKAIEAPSNFIALDSETTALYPRDGYMLGLSLSYEEDSGAYILTEAIDEEGEKLLQKLFYKKKVVFHNAKFDLAFFEFHFGFNFPDFEDTMLMHYMLDETQGTHGLKELALKHTKYGDYEKEQQTWIDDYCKKNRILKKDFTFDLIPFDIIKKYAAIDSAVTYLLFIKFNQYLRKNQKLSWVYDTILIPGCRFLTDIQDNGVPFDKDRLLFAQKKMSQEIADAEAELFKWQEIQLFQEHEQKDFNPNSTVQLRKLLFDYCNLKPTGKQTAKGADSTDSEVLEKLSEQHDIPKHILSIRKSSKIKNTYLDKIIPQLDRDGRLRTNFNLHVTTSGRLSSSGKLNMQQLPRDNPAVKGCIKAKDGFKIVSMDLTTAEMYIAAVLSDDLELQDVFRKGGNFHSQIAKKVFGLNCSVEEVEYKYKLERQSAKAISFGILYGASAKKIADTVNKEGGNMTVRQAQATIDEYFNTFWKLKEWIDETKGFIETNAYVYSPFGRKRRLPNVKSDNSGVVGHEIRSGLNFTIQSTASDVNLLGAIDMHSWLQTQNNPNAKETKIFALVHDSILAEVREEYVEEYCKKLQEFIQKDRGVSIPGIPIGCDFEIGQDYSMGKFIKEYGEEYESNRAA